MLIFILALAAADSMELTPFPETATQWLLSYDRCLEENYVQIKKHYPIDKNGEVARRSIVRCWPTYVSARNTLTRDISKNAKVVNFDNDLRKANYLLEIVAASFAVRNQISLKDLGELYPSP